MQAVQAADDAWQQIGRNGGNDADAQPSGEPPPIAAGKVTQLINRPQDVTHAGREFLSKTGQPDLPGAPLHQRPSDDVLQVPDLGGEGRLRNAAGLGRPAKMAVLGLGYVGLPLAVVFGDAGFDVVLGELEKQLAAG